MPCLKNLQRTLNLNIPGGPLFLINLVVVPLLASWLVVKGFGTIMNEIPSTVLLQMIMASVLWGAGVMLWGKAIDFIGLSLGFSIFIGTVILIGSLLPFLVDGLPPQNAFLTILGGILVVLVGVIANGKAGIDQRSRPIAINARRHRKKIDG